MRLIDDWRNVLLRSGSALLAYFSTIFYGVGAALFVYADELGDTWFFTIDVACFALAGLCTALIPLARVIRQKGITK